MKFLPSIWLETDSFSIKPVSTLIALLVSYFVLCFILVAVVRSCMPNTESMISPKTIYLNKQTDLA